MDSNYRVVEVDNSEDGSQSGSTIYLLCWVNYDEAGKIISSTEPGIVIPSSDSVDGLREEIRLMSQAVESPVLHLHDLPGSGFYVDPDQPTLSETPNPTEGFDDGSDTHAPRHLLVPPDVDEAIAPSVPVDALGTPDYREAEIGGEG